MVFFGLRGLIIYEDYQCMEGPEAYMKFKKEYETHRLPNGRFGGWKI